MSASIDLSVLKSLPQMLQVACKAHASCPAFVQMGRSLTYRELDERSRDFAAWLQSRGLQVGDRLAIMLPNVLQYPIALLGALRAGLVVVNTNPLYTARELEHQLIDSGAVAIVVLENFSHVLQEVLPRTQVKSVIVTAVGDLLKPPVSWITNYLVRRKARLAPTEDIPGALDFLATLSAGRRMQLRPIEIDPKDLAFLQYTGGTTGGPKGAMLTHQNICANVLQCEAWLDHTFDSPKMLLTALPLYHIFALTVNCLVFLRLGWTNVLIANPRDGRMLVSELRKHRVAFFSGVNTLFKALLNTPGFDRIDFSHLEITLAGGMAVEASVAERWKRLTGTVLTQAWGLTETSPGTCINPRTSEFNGSVGLPIPGTEVEVKDEKGADLAINEVGELCVRGPQVMAGYWNQPAETAKVMLSGGWLRTGDLGRKDQSGLIYIEDRKKDLIVVSGFKVYPNEVEAVILKLPNVLEVAAVAQPDEYSGDVVAIFIVPGRPSPTPHEVIAHARRFLTGYKVPKHVYFRAELPKTPLGKISRKTLRLELTQHKEMRNESGESCRVGG
jgi:long-chain acyl-CoA synthetase